MGKGTTSQKEVMIHLVSNEKLILFYPSLRFFALLVFTGKLWAQGRRKSERREQITRKMASSDGIAPV